MYDHKVLELDEMKKASYQMELKADDYEFVYRQLQEVRGKCERLEEERKDAVFREEAIKIQLENLL